MRVAQAPLIWLFGLAASLFAAFGVSGDTASTPDSAVRRRISLNSNGASLSSCVKAIGRTAGLNLTVDAALKDHEVLIQVQDASVDDALRSLAHLYRAEWRRISEDGKAMRLEPLSGSLTESNRLRRGCLSELSSDLRAQMQARPLHPDADPARVLQRRLGELVLGLDETAWNRLATDSAIVLPSSQWPVAARRALLLADDKAKEDALAISEANRLERIQSGIDEPPVPPSQARIVADAPPALLLEFKRQQGIHLWGSLWRGSARGYTSIGRASEESLRRWSRKPYPDTTESKALDVAVKPSNAPMSGDQENELLLGLRELSKATGLSIYADADCLAAERRTSLSWGSSARRFLNDLCAGSRPKSFWWVRGNAVYLRSEDWFLAENSRLPADLSNDLERRVRSAGRLTPATLRQLARLRTAQVSGLMARPGDVLTWHLCVNVPTALGATASEAACDKGFDSRAMTGAMLVTASGIGWPFPLPPEIVYRARSAAEPRHPVESAGIRLSLSATIDEVPQDVTVDLKKREAGEVMCRALN